MRRCAEHILSGDSLSEQNIAELWNNLTRLSFFRRANSIAAIWMLSRTELEPGANHSLAEALMFVAAQEVWPGLRRFEIGAAICPIIVAASLYIGNALTLKSALDAFLGMFILSVGTLAVFGVAPASLTIASLSSRATEALGRIKYVPAIPFLTQVLKRNSFRSTHYRGKMDRAAGQSLAMLLPELRRSAADWIGRSTVRALCDALTIRDEALSLAILNSFEMIGDAGVIPMVEKLSKRGFTESVRLTATRLLPLLYERKSKALDANSLLRPYDEMGEAENSLVRPAGVIKNGADQLVRPAMDDPDT